MDYNDIKNARQSAEATLALADEAVRDAARLVARHLRSAKVDRDTLAALKHELQEFNAVTHRWKPLR